MGNNLDRNLNFEQNAFENDPMPNAVQTSVGKQEEGNASLVYLCGLLTHCLLGDLNEIFDK